MYKIQGLHIAHELLSRHAAAYADAGDISKETACMDACDALADLIRDEQSLIEVDARFVGKDAAFKALIKRLYF